MKNGLMKQAARVGVGIGLVGAPALGGHLISGIAKAKSSTVAGWPDMLVDGGACAAVAAVETVGVALVFGKKKAMAAGVLALVGVGVGVGLSHWDDLIENTVRKVVGLDAAPTAAPALDTASSPAPAQLPKKAGGVANNHSLGGVMPGGRATSHAMGGVMPGGTEGVTSVRSFGGVV